MSPRPRSALHPTCCGARSTTAARSPALAADAGVPSDRVVDAVVRDANAKVDRAVADGRIASDRASMLRDRLPNWAEQLVLQTPRMLAGTGSGAA